MGNLLVTHCCFASGGAGAGARPLVVAEDGSRRWVEEHTGVAELMIDAPGHMVARASDVAKERRVRAMAADELLRAGEVYLLVPAGKAGARLGDREIEAIGMLVSGKKRSRKSRRAGGKRRVFPAAAAEVEVEDAALEGKEKEDGLLCAGKWAQDHHGLRSRQWRPALDTIYEA